VKDEKEGWRHRIALRLSAQLPDDYEDAMRVIREMERMRQQWEYNESAPICPDRRLPSGVLPFPGSKSGV
jgi:hypothetical protein